MTLRKPLPRKRRWQCRFCPTLNAAEKKKCAGCGVNRGAGRKSASKTADALWAQLVKIGGKCDLPGHVYIVACDAEMPAPITVGCSGRLEAAHIVPRRHRTTRWDPANGRALCHAHHAYFTVREKAWRDFIGPEWDRLWVKAQERWDGTYPISELRAALAARREAA